MTAYHGGKQRIGREIATIIHEVSTMMERDYGFKIKGYCEPFCGMLGVYQHIPELFASHRPKLQYKAGDTNESVIKMWKETRKGWIPPQRVISESEFFTLKINGKSSANKGFIGHHFGYMGKYFQPFKSRTINSIIKISKSIENISFRTREVFFKAVFFKIEK
jgi:hypothetical protein